MITEEIELIRAIANEEGRIPILLYTLWWAFRNFPLIVDKVIKNDKALNNLKKHFQDKKKDL